MSIMYASLKALTIAVVVSVVPATAFGATIVVTFDDLVGQADVPAGYGGINWSPNWEYYGFAQPPYTAHSSPNRVYNNLDAVPSFSFVTPDQGFDGAWFAGQSIGFVQFQLFNNSVLVATSGILNLSSTPQFLSSGFGGAVDEVRLLTTPGFFVMDDVTYQSAVTSAPEPASVLLLGSGLIGAGVRSWRKRKA